MNPRIAKEVRSQAPVFGLLAACAVAITAVVVQMPSGFINASPMLFGVYCIACLLMAAMTFGNEFHFRTMSLLLSQPVARRTLWPEKMLVLTVASASSALIIFIALMYSETGPWQYGYAELFSLCVFLVLVPVLFCCTAPYFTLVSKSTLGGIVFTIFGSGMLYVLSDTIWDQLSVLRGLGELKDKLTLRQLDGPTFVFVILSIPYAALLYWLGRRRFLQLEVIDSQSLEANLPQGFETTLVNFSAKFKSPFSRLLFKELRLQRISLMLTAAFCLFMVIERLTWISTNERTFIVAGTLYILPIFVSRHRVRHGGRRGKNQGMKDWHLILPPSLNKQWRVKWLVAITLSLVLGAGLTWLVSHSGPWEKEIGLAPDFETVCYPLLIAAGLYAGSISTSTIRALLLTFAMIGGYWIIISTASGILKSFRGELTDLLTPVFVIFYIMVQLYWLVLRVLSAVLVSSVYLFTHSPDKVASVVRWTHFSTVHVPVLFLVLYVTGVFWLVLRFARTNYRHSDLAKGKVVRQLLLLLLASIFLAIAVGSAEHAWSYIPVPWANLR